MIKIKKLIWGSTILFHNHEVEGQGCFSHTHKHTHTVRLKEMRYFFLYFFPKKKTKETSYLVKDKEQGRKEKVFKDT